MVYYIYSYYLLVFMIISMMISLKLLINKMMFMIEFEMMKFMSMKIEYYIYMDWKTLMFMSLVFCISSMVMIYSIEYMESDINIKRFMYLLVLFILSMILMIISPNIISILVGWDGLGLVSYCLVIYYQNESSFNSGMVTVLINRIGDIMIIMMIGLMVFKGTLSLMNLDGIDMKYIFILMIASFTKSAQIPFSTWLPLAMAAPTPVSSLVHSSTLVTAGVYLLIRLNYLIMDKFLMNLLMLVSILTMFLSGLMANFENDLKKVIALSTLSQLGVMMFCLSLKLENVAFFHLVIHALFKSMLFMCAGIIIHNMWDNQDIRYISMVFFHLPLVGVIFNCSMLTLCGMPFLSGFFSKDLILEMFLMSLFNKFILIGLFISMGLTVMYSVRLLYYSFVKLSVSKIYLSFSGLSSLMSISLFLLFLVSIFSGLIFMMMIFSFKNIIYLPVQLKLLIYNFLLLGGALGGMNLKFFYSLKMNMNIMFIFKFNLMMWFISNLYNFFNMYMYMNFKQVIKMEEMGWYEYLMFGKLNIFFLKMFKIDLVNKNFFYVFIIIISFLMMLFY